MDVISLSKASKASKDKATYQSGFLGEGVETHFSSLDERLDWLEGMFSSAQMQEVINLLVQDAELNNVEFVDGKLVLKHITVDHPTEKKDYSPQGTYKKTFDLNSGFISSVAQSFLKTVATNQTASIQYEASNDGITYAVPVEWSATTFPDARYIRVTITLASSDKKSINYATPVVLEPNEFIENNKLIQSKADDMTLDTTWTGEGSLHRKKITRDEWLRIDKLEVRKEL